MDERIAVALNVNGAARQMFVEPRKTLADALREDLALTGTHLGCEHGVCGACTVLLDGEAVRSCLMFAVQAEGAEVVTVEGLAAGPGQLSDVQQAMHECHGLQCGFCTPGFIVTITVNGVPRETTVPVRRLLSDALRHDLGLTGTHVGCEHGVCGACTVLVDGRPMRSCLLLAVQAAGSEIQTVEGLATDDGQGGQKLHPVQEAFRECHALQCGFCTPGFLMTIKAGLEDRDRSAEITEEEVDEIVGGNLCRCTGYANIKKAVRHAAAAMQDGDR